MVHIYEKIIAHHSSGLRRLFFTGCAAVTRTATDVGLGAGGAALGGELTHNNPLAIVGGAASGVLAGEALHYANGKQNDQSYQDGYDKGRSDAVNSNTGFTSPCSRPKPATMAGSGSTKCICRSRSLTA